MRNSKGMTLVELMFAAAVVSIALLSSVFVMLEARQISMEARQRLQAANAARSVLEAVKDTPLTSLSTINLSGYVPASLPSGAITLTTNPASLTSATLATVTVNVSWLGAKNRTQNLSVSTQRSRYS